MKTDPIRLEGREQVALSIDAAGIDRNQIRQFLRLSLVERLSWLDDQISSMRELRRLNPQLGQR